MSTHKDNEISYYKGFQLRKSNVTGRVRVYENIGKKDKCVWLFYKTRATITEAKNAIDIALSITKKETK